MAPARAVPAGPHDGEGDRRRRLCRMQRTHTARPQAGVRRGHPRSPHAASETQAALEMRAPLSTRLLRIHRRSLFSFSLDSHFSLQSSIARLSARSTRRRWLFSCFPSRFMHTFYVADRSSRALYAIISHDY